MFNISFGEVFMIAVVGLIIIGPKRLPETARFVGHLFSRVQRQVAGVKADIRREMELEDLKSMHREYQSAARDIGNCFDQEARKIQKAAQEAADMSDSSDIDKTQSAQKEESKSTAAENQTENKIASATDKADSHSDADASANAGDSKNDSDTSDSEPDKHSSAGR